ncbi:hypothetical protein K435DRAFT_856364 [Dendrothele bispora CBS 962.96]|uniref:CCHC-type domain-containing protein n=1 Tax=Dendrothele bispora (strain CBS 962.96) TaxID=1314807 RepID=A0A4S8M922_DENBC|nr:hypothetical protein K435DRAFT_856364 [Dendrothele bispora CBS 962.96]
MLTERSNDPRSPQSQHTPIPDANSLTPPGPQIDFPAEPRTPNIGPRPSRNSSPISSGLSIRITGPIGIEDRVNIPGQFLNIPAGPQDPNPRSYQSQYDSVMESALNQNGPAITTASTHPRFYPTPRDALVDVGRQCLRFGRSLGLQRINEIGLEDQVRAMRALAEARESDLPMWIVSQLRNPIMNQELNRLHAVIRQPEIALVIPEDPTLPDPWGIALRNPSPPATVTTSWQQLEQQRALEIEIEQCREELAAEVKRNAQLVLEQRRQLEELRKEEESLRMLMGTELRPVNPAPLSSTIYPSFPLTSANRVQPEVRIINPSDEEPIARNWMRNSERLIKCQGQCGHGRVRECDGTARTMASESEVKTSRDLPPHQTPQQSGIKPGEIRQAGYKYTPFPKIHNTDQTLRRNRRRLREILEDVEGERTENEKNDSEDSVHPSNRSESEVIYNTSGRPEPGPGIATPLQSTPIPPHARVIDELEDEGANTSSCTNEKEDARRISDWESRGTRTTTKNGNSSSSVPPPPPPSRISSPPPPPSSPPPPPPPPPPPSQSPPLSPSNENGQTIPVTMEPIVKVKPRMTDEDRSTRDAIARESKLEIRKPTAFDGTNRELWRPFLSDGYRMFSAKPTIYSTEQARVTYASSWFTGSAAKYYQNQVEQEMENGLWIPALHEWKSFVGEFGRLFGLHDKVLHAQSSLDKVIQRFGESFADFLVRFEDAALKTRYNDPAKRWRLLLQIRRDLRDRLTLVGRIPETFDDVGKNNDTRESGGKSATRTSPSASAKAAQVDSQGKSQSFRISREERDRRMNEGLCIRCGEKGHFGRNCSTYPQPIAARSALEWDQNYQNEEEEILYAVDDNGTFHQINKDAEDLLTDLEVEQGNGDGARDLNEGEN